jgi:prepilin-type N-terminal cleavage/methylation domain-containing protein
MSGRKGRRRRRRGYTVIEVMIALTLLAVGTTGIIAMQKVTAVANRDAKSLVMATQVARTWVERLRADAVQWNHPSPGVGTSDLADTRWLKTIDGVWFRPADDSAGSPTADSLGNDVRDTDLVNGIFCTNVRLSWLYGPAPAAPPPFLIRAEVRVYWLRDGGGGSIDPGKTICDPSIDLAKVSLATDRYHFVYLTSAIAQNMAP